MTYSQAYEKALQLATGFIKKLNLKPKDRVGIYSYNKW
jgi:acyl-CoA synthetase (AMP-forming)/AMP-acid ligase II